MEVVPLVVYFNPIEKYDRQNGNLPQVEVKIKKYLKPPPRSCSGGSSF